MKMIHENRSSSSFDANPIRSQLCTCHDSWAVVACAKLWPELVAICHVRVRYNLYEIWIMSYGGEPLLESVLVSVCRPLYKPVDAALSKGLDQSQIVPGQAVPGLKPADIAYFGILLRWDGAKKVIFAYFGWDRFLQRPASTHLDHPGRSCALTRAWGGGSNSGRAITSFSARRRLAAHLAGETGAITACRARRRELTPTAPRGPRCGAMVTIVTKVTRRRPHWGLLGSRPLAATTPEVTSNIGRGLGWANQRNTNAD